MDYVSCQECGKRLFYDGDWQVRQFMKDAKINNIVCDHCVLKLKKKIEKLKKHDRRRH